MMGSRYNCCCDVTGTYTHILLQTNFIDEKEEIIRLFVARVDDIGYSYNRLITNGLILKDYQRYDFLSFSDISELIEPFYDNYQIFDISFSIDWYSAFGHISYDPRTDSYQYSTAPVSTSESIRYAQDVINSGGIGVDFGYSFHIYLKPNYNA